MTKDRAIELAKKLYILARRGEQGEALNAQRTLLQLTAKFNIKPEEFGAGIVYERKRYKLEFNRATRKIFFQVVHKVTCEFNLTYWKVYGKNTEIEIELYPHEYVEITRLYNHYHRSYMKQLKKLQDAFIIANNIYSPNANNKENKSDRKLTPEERLELWETLQMANGITPESCYKELE